MSVCRTLHFILIIMILYFIMATGSHASAPVINQLKDQHLDTLLVENSTARVVIVAPADGRYDSSVNLIKPALEARISATVSVHPDTIDPGTILLTDNVIALGNSATNVFIKKLYRQWYTLLDLAYPGNGGYTVRSLHDPYGTAHNVIFVGGSDDTGVIDAANALTGIINSGSGNTIGRLMDINLGAAFSNLPVVGTDIGANIPAPDWDVSSWRDSHRDLTGGGTTGYEPATFFGWNPISIAGVLYYMTGDPDYLALFRQLALPDPLNIPVANQTSPAFTNPDSSPGDPLVRNYHYLSHLVDIIYDLIEDSPGFNNTERLQITNKLIEHQYYYDADNTYGNDNGGRHTYWHLFNIYTGSRYLDKYYPGDIISGHTWADRISKVQGHFNAIINNPTWGESDSLYWVSTSAEYLFDFFMMDNPDAFVSSGTAKTYMDAIEIMYTGAEVDDSSSYLTLNLLHKAAAMIGDSRYIWLRDQLSYDLQTPRIGQSHAPDPTLPVSPPTDLIDTVTVYDLPLHEWMESSMEIPSDEGFQILSFRNGLTANDDFLQLDGYFGRGRNPYHTNTIYKLRMFNGGMLLDGYENDLDITVDGLVNPQVPRATALKNSHATTGLAYLHTETPGMTGSVWERHILYLQDKAAIVIDNVIAATPGAFNITASWELGKSIKTKTDASRTITTSNSALSLANGLDVTANGNIVRQVLARQLAVGEEVAIGNILSSDDNPWTIQQANGDDHAFLVNDSVQRQGLIVVGSMSTPEFSVTADFAWFDDQQAVLSNATSFILNGQEQITTPRAILVLSVDMAAAIDNVTAAPPPPPPAPPAHKLNWLVDQQVQLLGRITALALNESLPDGNLWVTGTGMTDYEIIRLSQNDLSIQGSIIHSAAEPLTLWLAGNTAQASAFALLAGFKDDSLFAYDSAHNELWNETAEIDPSFITGEDENGDPVYEAPWFTDPNDANGMYTRGIYSILVDDFWGGGDEIVLGRPSTLEFRDLSGALLPLGRLRVEWGIASSLSLLRTSPDPLNNLVLAGKSYTGNPQITTAANPHTWLSDKEFASLTSEYTTMHAWLQRGLSHLTVADIENDGIEEVIYTLSGHWNELRVYDGSDRKLKWARYFGPADPRSDFIRAMRTADLDSDGNTEIIVGTKSGWIYVFNHQGDQLWKKGYADAVTAIEIISSGSDRQIVAGFEDGLIVTIDKTGDQLLAGQLSSAIDAIAVAGTDVFCGTRTGILARMDSTAAPTILVPPGNRPREIARWRFDESSGLTAGNGINPFETGALVSGPVSGPAWAPAEGVGGAIDFAQPGSRVEVSHSQTFDFDKQVSVASWIKLPQLSEIREIFLTKTDYANGAWNGFYINIEDDGRLRLVSNATLGQSYLLTAAPIDIDEWVHVVMTIDESEARFYINGSLSNAVPTVPEYNITNTFDLYIGSYIGGNHTYTGLMDDVRIFNYSLSEQEVADIYALVSHWPLDETSGTDVQNIISPADNGTLVNTPAWSPDTGINGALDFDTGISHSHVSVADSATFDFPDQLGASAWIYMDEYPTSSFEIFLSRTDYAGGDWHGFYLDIQLDGKLRLVSNAAGETTLKASTPVPLHQWVHVALTVEKPTGNTTLYVNGAPVASEPTNPALMINNTKDLTIGAYQGVGHDFAGLVDEVRIYNRSLSANQIDRLYKLELSKNTDSDNDGLSNYEEQCFDWDCNDYNHYHPVIKPEGTDLDYNSSDTDLDGYSDGMEIQYGSDPLDNMVTPEITPDGDINMDGVTNAADILLATRQILGLTALSQLQIDHGDLYPGGAGDGQITLSDLIVLHKAVLQ